MKIILKVITIILISLILMGCGKQDTTIYFKEPMILSYKTEENTLHLIDRIGSITVTDDMIQGNILTCGQVVIEGDLVDTSVLKTYEVVYKTNENDRRQITKTVKVRDITAPSITLKGLKNNVLTLTKEEFSKYDFSNVIEVKDNYDNNPEIDVDISEVTKNKEYKITITATDKFLNAKEEIFTIKIKEEPKQEETAKKNNSSQNTSQKSNQTNTTTEKKETSSSSKPKSSNSNKTSNASKYSKTYERSVDGYNQAISRGEELFNKGLISGYEVRPTNDGYVLICQ